MPRAQRTPAFPFYGKDAYDDESFSRMTFAEQGFYLYLAWWQWQEGSIPSDLELVLDKVPRKKVREARVLWESVSPFFVTSERAGRLCNPKIEAIRRQMLDKRERHADGAKKTNDSRWGGRAGSATRSERMGVARRRGIHTEDEWVAMLSIVGGHCVMCLGKMAYLYKDHIRPVIADDATDAIENIQPLCSSCNESKGMDSYDYRRTFFERLPDVAKRSLSDDSSDPNVLSLFISPPVVGATATANAPATTGGAGGGGILQQACAVVLPHLGQLPEPVAQLWLTEIDQDPLWLAAAMCDAESSLERARSFAYVTGMLKNRKREGWGCDDPKGYVEFRLAAIRRQVG